MTAHARRARAAERRVAHLLVEHRAADVASASGSGQLTGLNADRLPRGAQPPQRRHGPLRARELQRGA
eukprot:15269039-Heterocapsa_arctica.AAC.1